MTQKNTRETLTTTAIEDWYRNTIWGQRLEDDDNLFEVMSLQVFQAGLTWKMILLRRDGFRKAFYNWNIEKVSVMNEDDIALLVENREIIRNKSKIGAVIENARVIRDIQSNHGSFSKWFYDVIPSNEYPVLQKELGSHFKFMGPEISRMWLMASGRITQEEGEKYRPVKNNM